MASIGEPPKGMKGREGRAVSLPKGSWNPEEWVTVKGEVRRRQTLEYGSKLQRTECVINFFNTQGLYEVLVL